LYAGFRVMVVLLGLKAAETLRLELRTKLQLLPELESQPDHPTKVEPDAAVAVRVMAVPAGRTDEQVLPQLMPFPVTVPAPEPVLETVSV